MKLIIGRLLGALISGLLAPSLVRAQSNYSVEYAITTLGSPSALVFGYRPDFEAVTVDASGNVFVADSLYSTIVKFSASGVPTLFAGFPNSIPGGVDGVGTAARFSNPQGIAADSNGNVYVADTSNNTIRKITPDGVVTTFAGATGVPGSADGQVALARFSSPRGLAADGNGNLYLADGGNHTIRKISATGIVSTVGGVAGKVGSGDETDNLPSGGLFRLPLDVAVDKAGNIYITEAQGYTVRMLTPTGKVTTVAGKYGSPGSNDGAALAARFDGLTELSIDANGTLYLADTHNQVIRALFSSGNVTTLAGFVGTAGQMDGHGPAALFNSPKAVAASALGTLYIADTGNHVVRKGLLAPPAAPVLSFQPTDQVATEGGTATFSVVADGVPAPTFQWNFNGFPIVGATGATLVVNAQLASAGVYSVAITNSIGTVTSRAANLTVYPALSYSVTPFANGSAYIRGMAFDKLGTLFFTAGNAIYRLSSGQAVLFAGNPNAAGSGDGAGAAATFNSPLGLSFDDSGTLYVADSLNFAIRKISSAGVVSTLAGLTQGDADGKGLSAQFLQPSAVAADHQGNIYVVDGAASLRRIIADGTTTTIPWATNFLAAPVNYIRAGYLLTGISIDANNLIYLGVQEFLPKSQGSSSYYIDALKGSPAAGFNKLFSLNYTTFYNAGQGDGLITVDAGGTIYLEANGGVFEGTHLISSTSATALLATTPGVLYAAAGTIYKIAALGTAPVIISQSSGDYVVPYGASVTLSVTASGSPGPTFQWQLNGKDIPGATGSSYTATSPGNYDVVVTNSAGSVSSANAHIVNANRLAAISCRAAVGTDANVEIAGFVVSGPPGSTKTVLVRGAGPTLAVYGVPGALAQPVLTLFDSGGKVIAQNAAWNTAPYAAQIVTAEATTGEFAFPLNSADSALLVSLAPGGYTAQIAGAGRTTGTALAEVYEVDSGDAQLTAISTRASVGVGASVQIAGIVVRGSIAAKILVRAVGPALSQFGVGGVLSQPTLSVADSSGTTIATNTGWSNNANSLAIANAAAAVGDFALPAGSADSALLLTLSPGSYTAIVSGVNSSTGVSLLEVYQVP